MNKGIQLIGQLTQAPDEESDADGPGPSVILTAEEFLARVKSNPPRQLMDGIRCRGTASRDIYEAIKHDFERVAYGFYSGLKYTNLQLFRDPAVLLRRNGRDNVRVPAIGIATTGYIRDQYVAIRPILIVEILFPDNVEVVTDNLNVYKSLDYVREILVIEVNETFCAHIYRRNGAGYWNESPKIMRAGDQFLLTTIDLLCETSEFYKSSVEL